MQIEQDIKCVLSYFIAESLNFVEGAVLLRYFMLFAISKCTQWDVLSLPSHVMSFRRERRSSGANINFTTNFITTSNINLLTQFTVEEKCTCFTWGCLWRHFGIMMREVSWCWMLTFSLNYFTNFFVLLIFLFEDFILHIKHK